MRSIYGIKALCKFGVILAAILALRPRPLLSLLPFQAENKPDFSLHLNPLGVHLIHLFCGATPDVVSLLVLL